MTNLESRFEQGTNYFTSTKMRVNNIVPKDEAVNVKFQIDLSDVVVLDMISSRPEVDLAGWLRDKFSPDLEKFDTDESKLEASLIGQSKLKAYAEANNPIKIEWLKFKEPAKRGGKEMSVKEAISEYKAGTLGVKLSEKLQSELEGLGVELPYIKQYDEQ